MNKKNEHTNFKTFPFAWAWRGAGNARTSFREAVLGRKFSIGYLVIIWGVIAVLGYGSNRNCSETWQLALQCDLAFWLQNFTEEPLIFVRNLFTIMFLHNGLDHILFVSILGIFLLVQSYEIHFGFKETTFMFFLAYLFVGPLLGVFYNTGIYFWPESEFFQSAFERNWMGGSLGFFFMYGALAGSSKKPFFFLSFAFAFEVLNYFVLGISPHISVIHTISATSGFIAKRYLLERGKIREWVVLRTP